MKVLSVKNIVRKDVPIYYRRLFSGVAVLELVNQSVERKIDFSIETKPTGQNEISVTFIDPVDYPLVPLVRETKKFLDALDKSGGLPG
jgi:2-methylaconitate cis-trans-isomerase PrpF